MSGRERGVGERKDNGGMEGSTLSFPAATTTVTPAFVRAAIALFKAADLEPPIDIFRTAFPERPRAVAFIATFPRQHSFRQL